MNRNKKVKVTVRHLNFFFIEYNSGFFIEQRTGKGIWQNLFQLPLIETIDEAKTSDLTTQLKSLYNYNAKNKVIHQQSIRHLLTHQTIEAKFWYIKVDQEPQFRNKKMVFTNLSDYKNFAVPKLIENYLLLL